MRQLCLRRLAATNLSGTRSPGGQPLAQQLYSTLETEERKSEEPLPIFLLCGKQDVSTSKPAASPNMMWRPFFSSSDLLWPIPTHLLPETVNPGRLSGSHPGNCRGPWYRPNWIRRCQDPRYPPTCQVTVSQRWEGGRDASPAKLRWPLACNRPETAVRR